MEQTTILINRIFAEFMGYEVINYQHNEKRPIYNGNKYAKTVGEQRKLWGGLDLQFTGRFTEQVQYPFETDFNYLIPVIKRIEEMGFVVCVAGIRYQIYKVMDKKNPIVSLVCGDLSKKTNTTCTLLVQFITSYINNNPTNLFETPGIIEGTFLVLEVFGGPETAMIVVDEEGSNKIFDNNIEAQQEADECQEGMIIQIS